MGLKGDTNNDGIIGTLDVTRLLSYLLGLTGMNSDELINSDVNNDGNVSSDDVTHIMSSLAGVPGYTINQPEPEPHHDP